MQGQFDSPITLPGNLADQVGISGPLLDVDPKAEKAKVLFLIVQGEDEDAVTVEGEGTWRRAAPDKWFGKVDREGKRVGGGNDNLKPGPARGIGLAIAVKDGELDAQGQFIPPSIEALTWCVNLDFD
jgi:hypothetical protein